MPHDTRMASPPQADAPAYNVILLRYAEIFLKGNNRSDFLRQLRSNIRKKLRFAGLDWPVHQFGAHCVVSVEEPDPEKLAPALQAISETSGVTWYTPAHRILPEEARIKSARVDLSPIEDVIIPWAQALHKPQAAFRVRANRGYKGYATTSPEIERSLGSTIMERTDWDRVRLKNPDRTFYVDVQDDGVYLYVDRSRGIGGLPVGVGGRVLTLFSGGIGSPVAVYLIAARGCPVDLVHFTVADPHLTKEEDKIMRLARILSKYTIRSRLLLLPYVYFDMALLGKRSRYDLIIFRRFMAKVAETAALHLDALALATGDSIGQVASQTLENLVTNSRGVEMPILRPLLTIDKAGIVDLAREIGTYDPSLEPYKDCCAIISRRPKTRSEHGVVEQEERRLLPDYPGLIERTLADGLCLTYDCGRLLSRDDHWRQQGSPRRHHPAPRAQIRS